MSNIRHLYKKFYYASKIKFAFLHGNISLRRLADRIDNLFLWNL